MSTFIPPTPAATKSAEQHEEPSEQDSFNHLLYKVLRLTSEQVQDLNDWMKHRGIPNVHEIIVQNFCKPHALQDDLQFIRESKPCYIQSNVMVSLSLMSTYIKHLWYSAKAKHFGPFYYIQIDPQDYDEWRITPPEEEVHFQTPSKLGSPATPRSMATSEASESYITLTNFKKGLKGMPVPIPSSRMKGTTTPSFATSRQLLRHKDCAPLWTPTSHQDQMNMSNNSSRNNKTFSIQS